MADINVYIDQIEKARYGRDVRSSIVNSLKKVNDDNVDLKNDITNLESILRAIQEKLNTTPSVDSVTVNEINDMIVEYFENKTVSEVEA